MLQAVHRPVLDWKGLEELIKQEASLCYRLLRYLNSAAFGFVSEIRSIRHALSMLGEREIRRWISLVATLGAGQNKGDELVQSALVRAHFCELVSRRIGHREPDCFLVGLLSLIDAILGISMPDLLDRVSVDREIKAALLGKPSVPRAILDLVQAQENADWQRCSQLACELHVSEAELSQAYIDSIGWAREVSRIRSDVPTCHPV
jgi:EAL and modified HD-GYP domain-containing signal transduction protein